MAKQNTSSFRALSAVASAVIAWVVSTEMASAVMSINPKVTQQIQAELTNNLASLSSVSNKSSVYPDSSISTDSNIRTNSTVSNNSGVSAKSSVSADLQALYPVVKLVDSNKKTKGRSSLENSGIENYGTEKSGLENFGIESSGIQLIDSVQLIDAAIQEVMAECRTEKTIAHNEEGSSNHSVLSKHSVPSNYSVSSNHAVLNTSECKNNYSLIKQHQSSALTNHDEHISLNRHNYKIPLNHPQIEDKTLIANLGLTSGANAVDKTTHPFYAEYAFPKAAANTVGTIETTKLQTLASNKQQAGAGVSGAVVSGEQAVASMGSLLSESMKQQGQDYNSQLVNTQSTVLAHSSHQQNFSYAKLINSLDKPNSKVTITAERDLTLDDALGLTDDEEISQESPSSKVSSENISKDTFDAKASGVGTLATRVGIGISATEEGTVTLATEVKAGTILTDSALIGSTSMSTTANTQISANVLIDDAPHSQISTEANPPLTASDSLQDSSSRTSNPLPSFYQAVPVYAQNYTNSSPQLAAYRAGTDTPTQAALNLVTSTAEPQAIKTAPALAQAAQVGPTGNALHMKLTQVNVRSDSKTPWAGADTLSSFIGQEIDAHLLQRVLNQVSRYYRDLGFSNAQAFLPEQSLIDGSLEVYVAATKLQDMELENQTAVNDDYFQYLLSGITASQGQPINQAELESQLLKLSDLGIFDIRGGFRALDSSGLYADLELLAVPHDDDRVSFSVFGDNQGNESSGRYRFGGQLQIKSPFGLADRLSLFYARTDEQQNNYSLSYELPVNSHPSVLGVSFCYSNYELGQEYQILGAQGHSYTLEGYWREPMLRDASTKVDLQLGMRYRKLVDEFSTFDVEFKKHTIAGYASLSTLNALSEDTSVFGTAMVTAGKLFIDDEFALMPEEPFYLLNINAGVQHRFNPQLFWKTTLQSQMSNTSLEGSEQFLAGGAQGISALESADLAGDSGLVLRNELLFSPWPATDDFALQFGPHIEAASVSSHGYTSDSAASAGVGLSLWAYGLSANLDYSTVLGTKPEYAEDHSRIILTLSYTF